MRRAFALAAVLAGTAAPLLAQSADKPLGEILEAIEEEAPPPLEPTPVPEPQPRPLPPGGIGTTPLPPAEIDDPFVLAPDGEAGTIEAEMSEEAARQAAWEAAETARIEALDRARAEREAAGRRAYEESLADYERRLAEREAAIAAVQADYQAELERARRERAQWEARVRACNAGDRSQCAQPGEY